MEETNQAKPQGGQGNVREASRQGICLMYIGHISRWPKTLPGLLALRVQQRNQKPKGSSRRKSTLKGEQRKQHRLHRNDESDRSGRTLHYTVLLGHCQSFRPLEQTIPETLLPQPPLLEQCSPIRHMPAQWFSIRGDFSPAPISPSTLPWDIGQCLETFQIVTT